MGWYNKKEFVCLVCGKDFKKERQLRQHLKDAHNLEFLSGVETAECCETCGYIFYENHAGETWCANQNCPSN